MNAIVINSNHLLYNKIIIYVKHNVFKYFKNDKKFEFEFWIFFFFFFKFFFFFFFLSFFTVTFFGEKKNVISISYNMLRMCLLYLHR